MPIMQVWFLGIRHPWAITALNGNITQCTVQPYPVAVAFHRVPSACTKMSGSHAQGLNTQYVWGFNSTFIVDIYTSKHQESEEGPRPLDPKEGLLLQISNGWDRDNGMQITTSFCGWELGPTDCHLSTGQWGYLIWPLKSVTTSVQHHGRKTIESIDIFLEHASRVPPGVCIRCALWSLYPLGKADHRSR